MLIIIMGFNADDVEYDYEFSCPMCGSEKVIIEVENGVYYIGSCKQCKYIRNS